MPEYQMSWWVWLGLIISLATFGLGVYYALSQLQRVIQQTQKDWKDGVTSTDAYKFDLADLSAIKKEAVRNMYGAVIAGLGASFVISSYGWAGGFLFLGPTFAIIAGIVCNWCFWRERKDCKEEGRLA